MLAAHVTPDSPAEELELEASNAAVGWHLWLGIGMFVVLLSLSHLVCSIRRYQLLRPQALVAKRRQWQTPSKRRLRSLPLALLAFWRREIRRRTWLRLLHLGDNGSAAVIMCYYGLNFGLAFSGTNGDIDWIAHHCACLVFANLPLVIGLAGRNNVLSHLTGINYQAFKVLHRHAGRLQVILSAIHVGGRIYVNVPSVEPGEPYWSMVKWGGAAFVAFLCMALSGLGRFRRRIFSVFIITHTVATVFILIALWCHRPEVWPWLAASLALFVLDLVFRACKIVRNQVFDTFDAAKQPEMRAWAERLNEKTVKMVIRTRATWIAGAHGYLHLPLISSGGHPFSISSICHPMTQMDNVRQAESRVELLVRICGGLTHKLHLATLLKDHSSISKDFPMTAPDSTEDQFPLYAWLEGPFGCTQPIGDIDDVVILFSAGSGVSFCLPILMDLVRRKRAMHHLGPEKCAAGISLTTERIRFVWTIRRAEDVDMIEDKLKTCLKLSPPGFLSIKIFVTQGKLQRTRLSRCILPEEMAQDSFPSSAASTPGLAGKSALFGLRINATIAKPVTLDMQAGRPNPDALIEEELEQAAASDSVHVVVCGAAGFTESAVRAVTKATRPGNCLRGERKRALKLTVEEF